MSFDALLNIILGAFAFSIGVSLYRVHTSNSYKSFNLVDMITAKDGKVSRPACLEVGTWLMVSWGFVVLMHRGTITEWYVAAYLAAFVLRAAHSAYLSKDKS